MKERKKYILVILAALSIVLVLTLSLKESIFNNSESKSKELDSNLPILEFNITEVEGIPGIVLKETLENRNKNPWFQNETIKELPVFINEEYNLNYQEGPLEYLTEEESVEVSLLVGQKL